MSEEKEKSNIVKLKFRGEEMALLTKAAELYGTSIEAFARESALREAVRITTENDRDKKIVLTEEDYQDFYDSCF